VKNETKAWTILILLSIVWGSSFILMEKSMHPTASTSAFTPYQVGAIRILIAALVLLPIAIKNIRKFKGKNALLFISVGLAGNFIPAFLFPIAETQIQSSLAGLLNVGVSLFIIILSLLFFKTKISRLQFIGFLMGVTGLFLIVSAQINTGENSLSHAGIALLATLFYAISLSLIKYKLYNETPLTITSLAFFAMLGPAIAACFLTDSFQALSEPETLKGLPYLAVLSIIGTALAVLLFNYMVAISTPLFASSVGYIIPVIALLFGILDGEKFNLVNLVWLVLILFGVYLMGKKTKPKKELN
jgi:drug/metabolite transporter (DMT)-like permease